MTGGWRKARAWLLGLVGVVFLAGCGGAGSAAEPDLGDPATLGLRTFAQWCAPCHGAEGEGHINALEAPALNAAGDSYLLTDAEILDGIVKGGTQEGSQMQPLGQFLTVEQQMAALYYVHTLWSDEQRATHDAAGGHTPPTPTAEGN
ncbi:MAG TPA: c-type cytochrome [Promineifilum sp.]|nr:c-type cytochrome [Promineifilum sp.]